MDGLKLNLLSFGFIQTYSTSLKESDKKVQTLAPIFKVDRWDQ